MLDWIDLNSDSVFFLEMLDAAVDDLFCSSVWESELHDVGLVDDSVEVVGNGVIGLEAGVGRGIVSLCCVTFRAPDPALVVPNWAHYYEVEHKG